MPTVPTGDDFVSDLSDIRDLPLDAEVNVADGIENLQFMRRIFITYGEASPSVSAFNSSI